MIILRWLCILSIVNDSITLNFTDYQKTLFYLISCIVQVWKVENSFSLQKVLCLLSQLKTHSYERYICTQLLYKI